MEEHLDTFGVLAMSRVLQVARSGFYTWRQRQGNLSPRLQRRKQLDEAAKKAFGARKGRSGSRRLVRDLAEAGHRKTIAESIRRQGLRAKSAKKFKATKNSRHNLPVAPNLLQLDFTAARPNQKYVSDITFLWTTEGWLYLAVVIDLYSRLIVGWAMAERMTAQLVCDALQMDLWRRMPTGFVVHSDRGSQYCSGAYQQSIEEHALICSMGAKGNCYDNAFAKSFFYSLKIEAIQGERFATPEEMRRTGFEFIEVDYNSTRRHSANGFIGPEAFEALEFA